MSSPDQSVLFQTLRGCSLLALLLFLPFSGRGVFASEKPTVVITEIQTAGAATDNDFIELFNPNGFALPLNDWQLKKTTSTGTASSVRKFGSSDVVPARGFFLWANSRNDFSVSVDADSASTATLSANNSVALFNSEGSVVDAIAWGSGAGSQFSEGQPFSENPSSGKNLHRKLSGDDFVDTADNSSDFYLDFPNPRAGRCADRLLDTDCVVTPSEPPAEDTGTDESTESLPTILLNEILPNPIGDEKENEFIEIYNDSESVVDISGWSMRDASKSGKYVFPSGTILNPSSYLVIYRTDYKFALNNSGFETISLFDEKSRLFSSVSFENTKEGVSYNFTGSAWRWSKYLTPGEKNKFNNLPKIQIDFDRKVYRNSYADFSVKVSDRDKKDKIKVAWDFGDGRKSYKEVTRHKFTKNGKYKVSVSVFDGSEEVIKEQTVMVTDYPRRKVRIVRFMPNPKGKDTALEWIEIRNESKKKVNLNGWSMATGAKKLVNHWIQTDFEIAPKKSAILSRNHASFTLPNTRGKLELRYPDGKKAHSVSYKKDKIADNEVYERSDDKKWVWKTDRSSVIGQQSSVDEVEAEIIAPPEPELDPEDIGKFSENIDHTKVRKTIFSLVTVPAIQNPSSEIVLGASVRRLACPDNHYRFCPALNIRREHYAVRFARRTGERANAIIAQFLN